MTRPKDTRPTDEKQPLFGRIPASLLPKLRGLTHLDVHVFTVLSVLANFKREPLGEVCMGISAIARQIGIHRKSLYRSLGHLEASGLVSWGHSKCVMVTHYTGHGDTPPVSLGHADQPQLPIESSTSKAPIRSEEDHKKQKAATATNGGQEKPKAPVRKKRVPRQKPFLYWDDRDRIKAREDDPRFVAWFKKWAEALGSEDRVDEETEKAIEWLRARPKAVAKMKSYPQFMDRWLEKEIPE